MLENSFGLTFFLKKSTKKNEKYVYLRITVDGIPKEVSTKHKWDPERWNQKTERAVGIKEDAKTLNFYIETLQVKIQQFKNDLILNDETITSQKIMDFVKGKSPSTAKLLDEFQKHNDEMLALVPKEYAKGTHERFVTARSHVQDFIRFKYNLDDIEFRELNYEFVKDYEFYLKTVRQISNNTALKYISNLKKIILRAIARDVIPSDPFKLFKGRKTKTNKKPLTKEDLERIENYEFATTRLAEVRDIFIFQCYTGLAYIDAFNLKKTDIKKGYDEELWIMTARQKTDSETNVPLLPKALEIMHRYSTHPICMERGSVLPVKSNQKMNAYLKEIADLTGVECELNTHKARRTFASTVTLANNVPIHVVKEMLGHHSVQQTEEYAITEQQSVGREMKQLQERLSEKKPQEDNESVISKMQQEINELKALLTSNQKRPLTGMSDFYRAYGKSNSTNFQITGGFGGFGGFLGRDNSESDSETDVFFTDGNSDGLPDIVKDGEVYFNRLDANGNPVFEPESKKTENMIITAAPREIELPIVETTIDYPEYDVVKVWEAPADGTIKIENNIELLDASKEANVTIEMQKSETKCYEAVIYKPVNEQTMYQYSVFSPGGAAPYRPGVDRCIPNYYTKVLSFKVNSAMYQAPGNLFIAHGDINGPYNQCPTTSTYIYPTCEFGDPSYPCNEIQSPDFETRANDWFGDFMQNYSDTYDHQVANASILQWDVSSNYLINKVGAFWYFSSTSPNYYCEPVTYAMIGDAGSMTPYTYNIGQNGPDSSYPLYIPINASISFNGSYVGSYDLYGQEQQFRSDFESLYPGAEVDMGGSSLYITIRINSTGQPGDIVVTPDSGIPQTYSFVEVDCGETFVNSLSLSNEMILSKFKDIKPSHKEVEKALLKFKADGGEINMSIPEIPLVTTVTIDKNNSGIKDGTYGLIKEAKVIRWINPNGELIVDEKTIKDLKTYLPDNIELLYEQRQQAYKLQELRRREQARDKAIVSLGDLYKSTGNLQPLSMNQSTCAEEFVETCLLFGAELNSGNSVINEIITNNSTGCHDLEGFLYVRKGDRIYFRVHANENNNSIVSWNPKIEYTNPTLAAIVDPNGLTPYKSSYSDGFILSSGQGTVFPGSGGTALITWTPFQVNPTDVVKYEIFRRVAQPSGGNMEPSITQDSTPLFSVTCNPNVTTTVAPTGGAIQITVPVPSGLQNYVHTEYYFKVTSTSNVNWKAIEWKPKMMCTVVQPLIGENNVTEGNLTTTQTLYPIPDYSIHKQYPCGPAYTLLNVSTLNGGNGLSIKPNLSGIFSPSENGVIYFVVKRGGQFMGRRKATITNGNVTWNSTTWMSLGSSSLGNNIEIVYTTDDSMSSNVESHLRKLALTPNTLATITWTGNAYNVPKSKINLQHKVSPRFGPMYRQWGQFMYNPEKVIGAISSPYGNLIKEEALTVSEETAADIQEAVDNINNTSNLNDGMTEAQLQSFLTQFQNETAGLMNTLAFIPAKAERKGLTAGFEERWVGFNGENYASAQGYRAASISESVLYGGDYYLEQDVLQTGAYAISKYSDGNGINYSGGFNVGGVGFGGSKSWDGESNLTTDYIDFNGDGYPDIVGQNDLQYTNATGGLLTKTNRSGHISVSNSENTGLSASGSFSQAGDEGSDPDATGSGFQRFDGFRGNTGAGISGSMSEGSSKAESMWMDINGDGLSDYLKRDEGNNLLNVSLNNGTATPVSLGSWSDAHLFDSGSDGLSGGLGVNLWNGSVEAGVSVAGSKNSTHSTMVDMNGDGLMDLVNSEDALEVKINVGNKFISMPVWTDYYNLKEETESLNTSVNAGFTFALVWRFWAFNFKIPAFNWNGSPESGTTSRTKKSISDYDGDGYPDLIEEIGNNSLRVHSSNIRRTDMLKSVNNPLGGKFTVDYKVITPTYDNPHPKWVMTDVIVEDGYDLENDGFDAYKKTFEYEDGRYDRREREFYGFETVKTIDHTIDEEGDPIAVYRTSVSKYHNRSYFLNGLMKESYIMKGSDDTKLFSKTVNSYTLKGLNSQGVIDTGSDLDLSFDTGGTEGRKGAAALLTKTQNYIYELGTEPLVHEINMNYDQYARVIEYLDKGTPDPQDDYKSVISYHETPALLSKNILVVPSLIEVHKASSNALLRKRTTDVNEQTGDIIAVHVLLNDQDTSVTAIQYDGYGNISSVTMPPNLSAQSMIYVYEYDSVEHKYVTKITDSFNYISTSEYDARYDKVLLTTDITGNIMWYEYDNFGRMSKIYSPKEIANSDPYTIKFNYYPIFDDLPENQECVESNFIPLAVTSHFDKMNAGNDIETITLSDGLGRAVQVKKDIELNTGSHQQPNYSEYMSFSGVTQYDEFGRGVKQYHPGYEQKDCHLNYIYNQQNTQYYSEVLYDEIDRTILSIDPEGNESEVVYSIEDDFFGNQAHRTKSTVQQSSQENIISESYSDVRGRVTSTKNILTGNAPADIWTRFTYNAIGELLTYTDNENVSTVYKYDYAGRKIEINHPDNGKTTYIYDKTGQMVKLQTANLFANTNLPPGDRFIVYEYDHNRPIAIKYPATPSGDNIANTYYEYGSSGNQTGRIAHQIDATGEQYFEYGNMGEVIKNTRKVVGPNIPTRTFETYFTYDSWNRLMDMKYPDGEVVSYKYNAGGALNYVQGKVDGNDYAYVKRIDYDHYEQRTYISYGNNTETEYAYTPALRRLNTLVARASNQDELFNNTYEYDKVGNVTSLQNTALPGSVNKMGGSYAHSYQYDNLNRLSKASGSFQGDGPVMEPMGNDYQAGYSLFMTYNTTHGIAKKDQYHEKNNQLVPSNTYGNIYSYYQGTHKLQTVEDSQSGLTENFDYDANGNLVRRFDTSGNLKNLYWDESNRLRVFEANSQDMQHYIYDASGERVLKAGSAVEQVYENGTLTSSSVVFDTYTTYPSAFIVVNGDGQYSKHYYAGTQRIVSRIGDQSAEIFETTFAPRMAISTEGGNGKSLDEDSLRTTQVADLTLILQKAKKGIPAFKKFEKVSEGQEMQSESGDENGRTGESPRAMMAQATGLYFYHPDHLGTSTYLTDASGYPYQFFLNLPLGETMAEQHSLTEDYETPYKFNGKELDAETGMYYYGARYYDPRTSIFLSVDPLAEKYPNFNPFAYCYQNPINFIDPTGMEGENPTDPPKKNIIITINDGDKIIKPQTWDSDIWHHITVDNVADADEQLKKYLNGSKVSNLVLNSHGSQGGCSSDQSIIQIGLNDIVYSEDIIKFEEMNPASCDPNRNINIIGVANLLNLSDHVEDGGNFVFLSCTAGQDEKMGHSFSKLINNRISLYFGKGLNEVQFYGVKTDNYRDARAIFTKRITSSGQGFNKFSAGSGNVSHINSIELMSKDSKQPLKLR